MVINIRRNKGHFVIKEHHFDNYYFKGIKDGEVYAYSHIQIEGDIAYMHLYMDSMDKSTLKELRKDFKVIKRFLKAYNVSRMVGSHVMDGCEKWSKFVRLLGFGKPQEMIINGDKALFVVLEV